MRPSALALASFSALAVLSACSDPGGLPFGGGSEGGESSSETGGSNVGGESAGGAGTGNGSAAGGGVTAGCGDAVCSATETCQSCMADCGPCASPCGDGVCGGGESCQTCPADCGTCSTCAHDKCVGGEKLAPECDPCVASICQADPFCCDNSWDSQCVGQVSTVCGESCAGSCGDGSCSASESCQSCPADCGNCGQCTHNECTMGGPLDVNCSSCTALVCGSLPSCCTTAWSQECVAFSTLLCQLSCV